MTVCATCKVFACRTGRLDAAPDDCPMKVSPGAVDTREIYNDPAIHEMARASALVEAEGYCEWTRVEETMQFARRLGVKKLGLAFCLGLKEEAKSLTRILTANGFDVASACCKTGSILKSHIDVKDDEQVRPGTYEPMCNPIGQARLCNEANTGLNIVFGLCVGHDSLFIKYSDASVTCLVAKDRALAHNPLGAIYGSQGYFKRALYERHQPDED